jgi:hypothetical protein
MIKLYVAAGIAAIARAPALFFHGWRAVERGWRRARALFSLVLLLAGCGPVEIIGSGTGGGATTTTTEACAAAACVPGSYPVCDDGSTPEPCCNDSGGATSQCVLPEGALVHSPACDAFCGTPAALSSSCALAPDGSLTCCAGGVCAADGGAK